MNVVVEVLGWTGAALVVCAYLLSARDVWPASSAKSAAMNIMGAALLIVNAWYHDAFPSVALNVVWIAIGATAFVRAVKPATG